MRLNGRIGYPKTSDRDPSDHGRERVPRAAEPVPSGQSTGEVKPHMLDRGCDYRIVCIMARLGWAHRMSRRRNKESTDLDAICPRYWDAGSSMLSNPLFLLLYAHVLASLLGCAGERKSHGQQYTAATKRKLPDALVNCDARRCGMRDLHGWDPKKKEREYIYIYTVETAKELEDKTHVQEYIQPPVRFYAACFVPHASSLVSLTISPSPYITCARYPRPCSQNEAPPPPCCAGAAPGQATCSIPIARSCGPYSKTQKKISPVSIPGEVTHPPFLPLHIRRNRSRRGKKKKRKEKEPTSSPSVSAAYAPTSTSNCWLLSEHLQSGGVSPPPQKLLGLCTGQASMICTTTLFPAPRPCTPVSGTPAFPLYTPWFVSWKHCGASQKVLMNWDGQPGAGGGEGEH